jgi:hypothetical protein
MGICQRICKAHVFDETFGVNRAFNAEVFVAAPHAVAMEFDLFGERRSNHWVKGAGSAKGNFWLDSALENRTIVRPDPGFESQASLRLDFPLPTA